MTKPLQQVVNRYNESIYKEVKKNDNFNFKPKFEKLHIEGPLVSGVSSPQYKQLVLENVKLNICPDADGYISILNNNTLSIVKVVNICCNKDANKEVLLGRQFEILECFFKKKPIKSSDIRIYKISNFSKKIKIWNINDITTKYMVLQLFTDENLTVAILIIHFNN